MFETTGNLNNAKIMQFRLLHIGQSLDWSANEQHESQNQTTHDRDGNPGMRVHQELLTANLQCGLGQIC